jgi:hypothetical protein
MIEAMHVDQARAVLAKARRQALASAAAGS